MTVAACLGGIATGTRGWRGCGRCFPAIMRSGGSTWAVASRPRARPIKNRGGSPRRRGSAGGGAGGGRGGARRNQLTTGATAQVNQIRDLLECAWPAVLTASGSPFRSASWRAALAVVLGRCAGDLARVRRMGEARFTAAVRRELPRWGATPPCLRIVRAVVAALADPARVPAHRPRAPERADLAMAHLSDP